MRVTTAHLRLRVASVLPYLLAAMTGLGAHAPGSAPRPVRDGYERLARAVVRLEGRAESTTGQVLRLPAGTGFLVQSAGQTAIVTARHVAEAVDTLYARIPVEGGTAPVETAVVPRTSWRLVDRDTTTSPDRVIRPVDLAVALLPAQGHRVAGLRYCAEACPDGESEWAGSDPKPFDSVILCGFPDRLGLDLAVPRPVVRRGMIAMTADEPYVRYAGDGSYGAPGLVAVDITSSPGNSGSPLFVEAEGRLLLAGLLSGYDEGLGLAYAVPVSRIITLLDDALSQPSLVPARWVKETE